MGAVIGRPVTSLESSLTVEPDIAGDGLHTGFGAGALLIHFELRGSRRRESLGSGESTGDADPLQDALDDLRSLHGGVLPAGAYRYMAAIGEDPRWEEFDLGPSGVPMFDFGA
jgi:hypothetical protein